MEADIELCDTSEEGGYRLDSVSSIDPLPSGPRQSSPQAT
jgi:hypothetical protein